MHLLQKIIFKYSYFIIILFSALILIPFTGNVHLFDWDEINFAECAREMIVSNSYHVPMINFQPFWEKPPLFIWMQVVSMKIFGINEFAARFPNIINGIITLCLLYYFGKKWYSSSFGWLWAFIHLGSILPHLYFRSGIIDPWYNLFGFIFFAGILEFIQNKNIKWLILGSVSLGLSVITKGPAMILIVIASLVPALLFNKIKITMKEIRYFLLIIFISILSGASWFLYEYFSGNTDIIYAFIDYQIRLLKTEDSGHGGFLLYHFTVVLLGCFPASVIMLKYFSKDMVKDFYSKSMLILLLVVLIIFSIVKTKIVHYSSMSYYSVSFLSAYVLSKNIGFAKWQKILMLIIGCVIGLIIVIAGNIEHWKHLIIPYLEKSDVFAAENLKTNVEWYGFEFLLGLLFIAMIVWYVYQKNYSFKNHYVFFILMIIWICLTINNFAGKAEQYSQNSAIVFFKYCAEKNYVADTYGYKSYAPLFYGKRFPPTDDEKNKIETHLKNLENAGYDKMFSYNMAYLNWLIYDNEKYPVFLVCKIQNENNLLNTGKFKKLYSKGGYVFFMKQQ